MIPGKVSVLEDAALDSFRQQMNAGTANPMKMKLKTADIYKELRLRGYDYSSAFQGILESSTDGGRALPLTLLFIFTIRFSKKRLDLYL